MKWERKKGHHYYDSKVLKLTFKKYLETNFPPCQVDKYRIYVPDILRQYGFSYLPKNYWRPDYAWPDYMLIVEIDGGAFLEGGGGHNRGAGFRKDHVRHNTFKEMGYRVYRFLPEHLPPVSTYAVDILERFFNEKDK